MKQAMIDYTKNKKHDHFDTPEYAIKPLLQYINPEWVIWEPTDTVIGQSKIPYVFREKGIRAFSTSMENLDFLANKTNLDFDCIITNPPYSLKDQFIERCIEYGKQGKKWAMLMPLTALEGIKRGKLFKKLEDRFGVLIFDRRVEFTGGSVWFNTSWFCYDILPKQLIFTELNKV